MPGESADAKLPMSWRSPSKSSKLTAPTADESSDALPKLSVFTVRLIARSFEPVTVAASPAAIWSEVESVNAVSGLVSWITNEMLTTNASRVTPEGPIDAIGHENTFITTSMPWRGYAASPGTAAEKNGSEVLS
eukprot:Amastigsp_a176941_22.p4 type:complete len:134 gc:universal Amastigsp_a176941_22:390-791(+)